MDNNIPRLRADAADPLLVTAKAAAAMISVSPATWHRMVSAGKTPAPIRLSPGCVRFDADELRRWVTARRPDGTLPDRKEWEALRLEIDNGRPVR